jgi:hypothetical protein
MSAGTFTSVSPRSAAELITWPPSKIWKTAATARRSVRHGDHPWSEMKVTAIAWPKNEEERRRGDATVKPIAEAPDQMGLSLECSPAPTAALVRMPTAIAMPSDTMKVIAAQESAIWWAASGTAPSQPIMTVAAAKAPPSKRRHARPSAIRPRACA